MHSRIHHKQAYIYNFPVCSQLCVSANARQTKIACFNTYTNLHEDHQKENHYCTQHHVVQRYFAYKNLSFYTRWVCASPHTNMFPENIRPWRNKLYSSCDLNFRNPVGWRILCFWYMRCGIFSMGQIQCGSKLWLHLCTIMQWFQVAILFWQWKEVILTYVLLLVICILLYSSWGCRKILGWQLSRFLICSVFDL